MRAARNALFAALLYSAIVPSVTVAQLEPPSTGGAVALAQELRMLGHYRRVLMVAAHPDDEDTELLTVLVRGLGAEAAYLSLNRGEGGQNLIGDELGEGLGLLRSQELLAARRLDGARQYFTRAYDFGYSKSLDDTWAHWPRDSVLKDVVRTIRRFRPQILVSIFRGAPPDGHGQHQAAGWAAQEAYRIAGDSTRFPELWREEHLAPWTPAKLYRSTRFDSAATTLTLPGGVLDPVVGQSYHQIAMRGRSLHRSQDMGRLQGIGPSPVRLSLLDDRTGRGAGGLFDGVDTSFAPLAGPGWSAEARQLLLAAEASARQARGDVARLVAALAAFDRLEQAAGALPPELQDQRRHLDRARVISSGLVFDALVGDGTLVPGQADTLVLTAWNTSEQRLTVRFAAELGFSSPRQELDAGWAEVGPGAAVTRRIPIVVPPDAGPERPYFLRSGRVGDLYSWPGGTETGILGLPFQPPALVARFTARAGDGPAAAIEREVAYRYNDQALGEVRHPVVVVPGVDVKLDPPGEVWRTGATEPQHFRVTLTHRSPEATAGEVAIELPAGWSPLPAQRFRMTRQDEQRVFDFSLVAPVGAAGSATLRAVVTDTAGRTWDQGSVTVDYPHIRPRTWQRPAVSAVRMAPLALPPLGRVAYVRGAADGVPEALQSVGVLLDLLTGRDLATTDLRRYRVLVIGPRAYETDPDLPAANDRVLAFAQQGGLVITQYQQFPWFLGGYAPFPLTVGDRAPNLAGTATATRVSAGSLGNHERVADETAPVRVLDPTSPVFRSPNRIGPADWDGWVQERGLYFAHSWSGEWKPLLEMHDPGEGPLQGGLLVAQVGRGSYVYTGLSFFRQLPARVPGAYRLFANLMGLNRKPAQ